MVNAALLAIQPLALNVIGLFATAYIIRQLGPLQYGQWAVAATLAAVHLGATNIGLRSRFIRAVARSPEHQASLLAHQLALRLAIGVIAALSCLCWAWVLQYPPVVIECAAIAGAGLIITAAWTTLGDVTQAHQAFRSYTAISMTAGLTLTALSVVVVTTGGGPVALTAAYLTGPVVSLVAFGKLVSSRYCAVRIAFAPGEWMRLLADSRHIAGQQIATAIRDRIEQLLLPKVLGVHGFGMFAAAAMPSERLALVPDGVATAYYPRIILADRAGSATASVASTLTLMLGVCLPAAACLTALSAPIASILLPADAALAESVIRITAWALPIVGAGTVLTYALQAVDRHALAARRVVAATVPAIGAALALVAAYGMVGAAYSLLVKPLVILAFLAGPSLTAFPGVVRRVPLLRLALGVAAMLAAAYLLRLDEHSLLHGVVRAAAALGVYTLFIVVSGVVPFARLRAVLMRRRVSSEVASAAGSAC